MPSFLSNCACNGIPPAGIVKTNFDSRPDIIGKLLKDRHVVRFLNAPQGFGKSTIAFEYASMMFSFEHVFWIRCDSPYFLRDLDSGCMKDALMRIDTSLNLVVFDDIPELDGERIELFCELVNGLIDEHCEVLVCLSPSFDMLSSEYRQKVIICAPDLLLTDDELEIERLRGTISELEAGGMPVSKRIPALIWGNGEREIMAGLRRESLSSEIWLFMFTVLTLGRGRLSDIELFCHKQACDDAIDYLEDSFPLLGIDKGSDRFRAMDVSMKLVIEYLDKHMKRSVSASSYADVTEYVEALADALMRKGEHSRACELIRLSLPPHDQGVWLCKRGWSMLDGGYPLEFLKFADKLTCRDAHVRQTVSAYAGWALFAIGEMESALNRAKRAIRVRAQDSRALLASNALICMVSGMQADLMHLNELLSARPKDKGIPMELANSPDWESLAFLMCSLLDSRDAKAKHIREAVDTVRNSAFPESSIAVLAIFSSWLLSLLENMINGDAAPSKEQANLRVESLIERTELIECIGEALRCTESLIEDHEAEGVAQRWATSYLRLSSDKLRGCLTCGKEILPGADSIAAAQKTLARYSEQASLYRQLCMDEVSRKSEFVQTHPDPFRSSNFVDVSLQRSAQGIIPLNIKLFGGLEVTIGNTRVDPKRLSRRKSQIALAMLAMNKGKEISAERLAETLWPESDPIDRRNNLYSVWSQLKRAFRIDKQCPYLIRTQYGCSLDSRYFHTDLERFEDLCKKLVFGNHSSFEWEKMYAEVTDDFSEDILPAETENAFICSRRDKCKMQLVDGMVRASTRLLSQNEVQGALWFARDALLRCDTREDVYIALMEAQIAANQRSLALETYFQCRKTLIETLGIDPSLRIVELYRSIIESEEMLI